MACAFFALLVVVSAFVARADLLASLDSVALDASGASTGVVRIVSSAALGSRLNESDFAVAISAWSDAGQPPGYASCTISLEVLCATATSYLATLVAAPANLLLLVPQSRPVCATLSPGTTCSAELVVAAPYSATVQSYRVAVALDGVGSNDSASVFIALAAPLDPCPAPLQVEAALPTLPASNPMRIAITTNATTYITSVTATLRNNGEATTEFFALLSCPPSAATVRPDTALRCMLAAGASCPVEWAVVPLQPGLMACQMRFAVARLPCWSSTNKWFETQIAIIVPVTDNGMSATTTIVVAVVAAVLGVTALALLALVIAWATSGCLRVRTDADAAKSRAFAANFFRTRFQRKHDPALSFAPLRDRDTIEAEN